MEKIIALCAVVVTLATAGWAMRPVSSKQPKLTAPQVSANQEPGAKKRREHMARLVAETAAATAEKSALAVLARKSGPEQTAAR